ncbi:hypothetical protein AAC387_Pa10g1850 [Persea americana]
MASNTFSSLYSFLFFFFFLFLSKSLADIAPSTPITPTTACNSTPDPRFCKSVLPTAGSSNLYDYGRFSVRRSLSVARRFTALVDGYLKHSSSLTQTAVRALEDCKLLSELNTDFLSSAASTLNSTNTLQTMQTDDVQTLLSAILTNQQTCLDGLQATSSAWSIKNSLYTPLSNGTRLFSVSLALFTHAWAPKQKKVQRPHSHPGRNLLPLQIDRLSLAKFKTGRKLLQSLTPDGVVVRDIVVVAQDGSGNYTNIQDAVAAAPNNTKNNDGFFLIYVEAGVYEEYVSIAKNKKNIMMLGDGINQTVITGNRSVVDGWTTFNSATFAVVGQRFVAVNITFRNTAGPAKHQAVAVRNGADLSAFYSCSFEGYQDTLYTHSLRQFYRNCDIYGTVDFIFGNAAVVFQNCNLYARLPMQGQTNVFTAQGRTDPNQNTGTSIHNCRVSAAADLAAATNGSTKTYLGRPWKEYSRTVYMQSFIDGVVDPSGWLPWSGDFALATLYYAEYNNTGPGSGTDMRVNWTGYHVINAIDASNFSVSNFLLGDSWLAPTGVPFGSSLL